jgi:hypothetical protein
MKKLRYLIVVLVVSMICFGIAAADQKNATLLAAKKSDNTLKSESADPANRLQSVLKDKNTSEIVKKKMEITCWNDDDLPPYCAAFFEIWCGVLCNDVSPAEPIKPNKKWGKKCNKGLQNKCERCGFI